MGFPGHESLVTDFEDGAWVGARATVLPGVTVKTHAIVAAGSVISKDAEPYMIYVGNPAVAVKERLVRGENNISQ